jgi:hypothetical protein
MAVASNYFIFFKNIFGNELSSFGLPPQKPKQNKTNSQPHIWKYPK